MKGRRKEGGERKKGRAVGKGGKNIRQGREYGKGVREEEGKEGRWREE